MTRGRRRRGAEVNTSQLSNGTAKVAIITFSVPAGQSGGNSQEIDVSVNVNNQVTPKPTPTTQPTSTLTPEPTPTPTPKLTAGRRAARSLVWRKHEHLGHFQPLTQPHQALLILNEFLTRGVRYSFVYELRDNEGGNAGYGLIDSSGNPKTSGTYVHNLTTILQDMKAGTPGSLGYSISNQPSTTHDLLLQRSDGRFFLIVWDEVYDGTNNTVTVNLGGTFASIQVFDPTSGTTAVQNLSNVSSVR